MYVPEPIEDEEIIEEALTLAHELAMEDRMFWGGFGDIR